MQVMKRGTLYIPAPPKFERVGALGHHSLSDWDITGQGNAGYSLDNTVYVSPPKSLKVTIMLEVNVFPHVTPYCNLPSTIDIAEGIMITWVKKQIPGGALYSYMGCGTAFAHLGSATASFDWTKYRFLWWNSWNLSNQPCLAKRLDVWDGSQWVLGGVDYSGSRLILNGTNRCFLDISRNKNQPTAWCWLDDTEIWRAA